MNIFNLPHRILLTFSILLTIVSCAQVPKVETTKPATQPVVERDSNAITLDDEREYRLGIEAISTRDYDQAKFIFKRFIKKNPNLSGAYINLALIEFKQGKYDQADWLSGIAIDLNPKQASAYNLRAQIHLKKGKFHKARDYYLKAININPGYARAHYNLALLYDIFLQEIGLAIEHYSTYLSLLDKEDENTRDWINHLKNTLENG